MERPIFLLPATKGRWGNRTRNLRRLVQRPRVASNTLRLSLPKPKGMVWWVLQCASPPRILRRSAPQNDIWDKVQRPRGVGMLLADAGGLSSGRSDIAIFRHLCVRPRASQMDRLSLTHWPGCDGTRWCLVCRNIMDYHGPRWSILTSGPLAGVRGNYRGRHGFFKTRWRRAAGRQVRTLGSRMRPAGRDST